MKTLLSCKADRLFAQAKCPLCGSHKVATFRCAEHFAEPVNPGAHTPNPNDRAMIKFYCGAEFSVDDCNHIRNRRPCTQIGAYEADAMNIDAETAYALQEFAA